MAGRKSEAWGGKPRRGPTPQRTRSDLRDSAVGAKVDTGAVVAVVGSQEQNGRGHLFRTPDAAERGYAREEGARAIGFCFGFELAIDDRRFDRTRGVYGKYGHHLFEFQMSDRLQELQVF